MTTFGERMVIVARNALADGPMGNKLRGADYREFIRCGFPADSAMANGGDIGAIATSCGIFAGAVMHHAGLSRKTKPRWGSALLGNWVHVPTSHKAWQLAPKVLEPGDVFYVGGLSSSNGHVGVLLEEVAPGQWITAEGGGGDGTRCAIRAQPRVFDPARPQLFDARKLTGIYRAAILDAEAGPGTHYAVSRAQVTPTPPAPKPSAPPRNLRLLTPCVLEMQGTDVERWQRVLGLPASGRFDATTELATRRWQSDHGLVADGVVGPLTRKEAGL